VRAVLAAALELSSRSRPKLCLMEPPPINERFAPAEGYTTHEALKAIFRHYADLGRKPRDGVARGVDRTQWAKLVSESPDLPARLATADADLVFAKVAASAEINQCVRPAWRYYLLLWPPRRSERVLGVLARDVLCLLTRNFDFRTGRGARRAAARLQPLPRGARADEPAALPHFGSLRGLRRAVRRAHLRPRRRRVRRARHGPARPRRPRAARAGAGAGTASRAASGAAAAAAPTA
jgi:hypothetical protein